MVRSLLIRSKFFLRKNASIKNYTFNKSKNLGNKQATEIVSNSLNIPRLTDEQKLSCEGSLTEEKCVKDLQSCQGNKRVPMGLAVN